MSECYMTVDVEDWFQTHNLEPGISRGTWPDRESRVQRNTTRLLDMFDEHDVTATFFVLGWIAERNPDLVEEIDRRGHEVASHGYGHELCYELDREELRADLERAHDVLSGLVDQPIRGYRAPASRPPRRRSKSLTDSGTSTTRARSTRYATTGTGRSTSTVTPCSRRYAGRTSPRSGCRRCASPTSTSRGRVEDGSGSSRTRSSVVACSGSPLASRSCSTSIPGR